MKKSTKQFGFTLMELMISLGITSALTLIIVGTLKLSTDSKKSLERTGEVNLLIQKITSELSRKEVCEKNFKGLIPQATPQNLGSIKNKNDSPIITANTNYGDLIRPIQTITYSGVVSSANPRLFKMNVEVSYQAAADAGKTITPKQFTVPINVFLNADSKIDTCYADIQSLLENAVEYACQGNNVRYYPKDTTYIYGHCEHEAEIQDSTGTVAPTCPPGELLQKIDIGPLPDGKKMIFKCAKFTTATTCAPWHYLAGVDSNGNARCEDIRTFFAGNGFTVLKNGTYTVQTIACPVATDVLQKIDASTGNVVCINPRLNYTCPPGQYVTGIAASGDAICSYASNKNACGTGYMTAIDSVGNVTCTPPALNGSCSGNDVITGVDVNGNVVCSLNQP